ncbi:zeta-crystallin [Halyomorpha halys]|uniref:zeta-crystallin n=1 Tax=Halyomorpha halys TaxID=286706 RepID=UPI0006D4EB14|nr:zeta-crystallin-like isoform X1 [Halyomorpha halys]
MHWTCFLRILSVQPKNILNNGLNNYLSKRNCTSLMKAVLLKEYGSPDVLKLDRVPIPNKGNSEVLVKVQAAGINPVDLYMREGAFMSLPPLPTILGKEVSGIVEEVGPDVKLFKIGDRVACCLPRDGGYAEYVTCNEKYLIPLSDKLTFPQGATLYVAYFVAYRALLTKCRIKKGEHLLVHGGSGGVGIAAIQIAKSKGLKVSATAGTAKGLEMMKAIGADQVFNHKEKGYLLKMYASTGGKGYDIILENCADINLAKDFDILSVNGRIAVVGTKGQIRQAPDKPKLISINPRSLIYTEGKIHGINLVRMTEEEFNEARTTVVNGVEEGWLKPIIGKEYALNQAPLAHKQLLSENIGSRGKIVFNLLL